MLTLYCLPLGESKRDDFVYQLSEQAAAGRAAEAVLLLPSSFLLNQVRDGMRACAADGHEQLKVMAFDELVAYIVGQSAAPRRFIDRMTQELLVGQVLETLADGGLLPYFSHIATFPGYISTITSLLGELKRTGTSPAEFQAVVEARDVPLKDGEILLIYHAYQQQLAKLGLAELEEMYLLAIAAVRQGLVSLPFTTMYISEFYVFTPLQLELIAELKSQLDIEIALVYEKDRPALYSAVEPTYSALVGLGFTPLFVGKSTNAAPGIEYVRRHLFSEQISRAADATGLELLRCPDRSREMQVVGSRIKKLLLNNTFKPEEIAVVIRDVSAYDTIRSSLLELGLPVSLPWDEPLAVQPVAQLLVDALTARMDGGSRPSVLKLIKSPFVKWRYGLDADAIEAAVLTSVVNCWHDWQQALSKAAAPNFQHDKCSMAFGQLADAIGQLPQSGTCAQFADKLAVWLTGFDIPQHLGRAYRYKKLPLTHVKAGLLAYQEIVKVLTAMKTDFAAVGQEERILSAAEFIYRFKQMLASLVIRLETRDSKGIQVISPAGVRGVKFRAVFIMGLSDGNFPKRERENWLYNDKERQLLNDLGLTMATVRAKRLQEDLYFAVAVAMATDLLVLSTVEDNETLPSPYIEEVTRLFVPQAIPVTKYAVNQVLPESYDNVYNARELICLAIVDLFVNGGKDSRSVSIARNVYEQLLDGDSRRRLDAEQERSGTAFGIYDGLIVQPAVQSICRQLAGRQPAVSISALEDYAACPFAYFAKRLLALRAWEEQDEEAGHDVIGTLYHEVLAKFLAAHRGEKLTADKLTAYQFELKALLQALCEQMAAQGDLIVNGAWAYEQQRLERVLMRWLKFEVSEQTSSGLALRPQFLEWSFGLALPGSDPASVPQPLVLTLGGSTVAICGKVDRIDLAGDKYVVFDYKKSSSPNFRAIEKGLDLQLPLYLLAVEHFLAGRQGEVIGGGYYSIEQCKKEGGIWRSDYTDAIPHRKKKALGNLSAEEWQQLKDKLLEFVRQYTEGIHTGKYVVKPNIACSAYCIARTICRFNKVRIARKCREVVSSE